MTYPMLVIDPRLCIGCRACEVACEREHNGVSHIEVYFIEELLSFSPLTCRHCARAPCVTVCPTEACRRDVTGIVYIDPLLCIGCRLCGIVCPFGVPRFREDRKVMVKCDLCIHRVRRGRLPACAETCPTDAISFTPSYNKLAALRRREAAERTVIASLEMESLTTSQQSIKQD